MTDEETLKHNRQQVVSELKRAIEAFMGPQVTAAPSNKAKTNVIQTRGSLRHRGKAVKSREDRKKAAAADPSHSTQKVKKVKPTAAELKARSELVFNYRNSGLLNGHVGRAREASKKGWRDRALEHEKAMAGIE